MRRGGLLAVMLAVAGCSTPAGEPLPPLVCCTGPTSAVVDCPGPDTLRYRARGSSAWLAAVKGAKGEFALAGLEPGTRYEYQLGNQGRVGSFVTARPPGEPFTFALISDPHIYLHGFTARELRHHPLGERIIKRYGSREKALWVRRQERAHGRAMLPRVAGLIARRQPDFVLNLGDIVDLHGFGFNAPLPGPGTGSDPVRPERALEDYRRLLGPLGARATHFHVLGNWDGEKGCFTSAQREQARRIRLDLLPTPRRNAGPHRDYYSFRWGDALCIVLNVISYTGREHTLLEKEGRGRSDQFTLGEEQLAWLERTLAAAKAPYRFLFCHHVVGGRGGDEANSNYGRGGGRAAKVGEQARVHELMRKHGVQIFFYGHDHVFTDLVVDGIHYTLPGSCGAPWKFGPEITGYERWWPDSGFGLVEVGREKATVTFINADDQVLHGYEVRPSR